MGTTTNFKIIVLMTIKNVTCYIECKLIKWIESSLGFPMQVDESTIFLLCLNLYNNQV
jgi:hypothetical protein